MTYKPPIFIEFTGKNKYGAKLGKFSCGYCGKEFITRTRKDGTCRAKSCNCRQGKGMEGKKPHKWKSILNEEHNYLIVIADDGIRRNKQYWKCECKCGGFVSGTTYQITHGLVKSCGKCSRRDTLKRQFIGEISKSRWHHIIYHAAAREIDVNITQQEAWNQFVKQDGKCVYTGVQLTFASSIYSEEENTASLDRIDSSKGYEIDNIQWVHKTINKMKLDMKEEEFFEWIRLICKFKNLL